MLIAIISIIMLVSVVLVLVVLAQNSKGGGLTSQFGGSGTSQLMGVNIESAQDKNVSPAIELPTQQPASTDSVN